VATFDADAYRAAREPFEVVVYGRRHRARPVSAELVIAVQPHLASGNVATATAALKRLLRAAFPWRVWMWFRGDPVYHVLYLDMATRNALITSFFRFLGGVSPTLPETSGTP